MEHLLSESEIWMIEKTLRTVRAEILLLLLVSTFSVSVSSGMLADGSRALIPPFSSDYFSIFLRFCELAIGAFWLGLSTRVLVETARIQKGARHLSFFRRRPKKELSQEEVREETFKLIRNLVGLYRGYYNEIRAVILLAIVIGFSRIAYFLYESLYSLIPPSEVVWEFSFTILMLIVPSVVYVYLNRRWGRKLLKIKGDEKRLEDFLGEPLEA